MNPTRKLQIQTKIYKEPGFGYERFLFITILSGINGDSVAKINFVFKDNEFMPVESGTHFTDYECAHIDKIDTILMIIGETKEEIMKAYYEMFCLHKDLTFIESTYSCEPNPIITKITTNIS